MIYYYHILLNFLTFRPLIVNITENNYTNSEVFFFPNQTCAYLWKSITQLSHENKKILFYIQGFDGNASTRFNVIKSLQNILSNEFDIIQFDLSGYGLSSQCECNLQAIQTSLIENINYSMNQYAPIGTPFSIMTENEAIVPVCKILRHLEKQPDAFIFLNPKNSLFDFMKIKYGIYMTPFFFSYFFDKKVSEYLKEYHQNTSTSTSTQYFLLKNEELYQDDYDFYFDLDFLSIEKKNKLTIKGQGPTSLVLHENHSLLKDFFEKV